MMQAAGLATIWVVMSQVPSLKGWSLPELWLIYGLMTLALSINHMFADNLWTLGQQYIRTGGFDRFLVRPVNPLFHLLADRFCHDGIGNFIVGLVLVSTAATSLDLQWTIGDVLYMTVAVLSGGLIFISLNLITCISAFWVMDSVPVIRVVFELHEFAKYPLAIYPNIIRTLLTFIIPFGLASYYPASYILGRQTPLYLAFAAPLVSIGLFLVAYQVWLFGLRHYSSTGS
jgi:ABC-2 type transport system permease protein